MSLIHAESGFTALCLYIPFHDIPPVGKVDGGKGVVVRPATQPLLNPAYDTGCKIPNNCIYTTHLHNFCVFIVNIIIVVV